MVVKCKRGFTRDMNHTNPFLRRKSATDFLLTMYKDKNEDFRKCT